MCCTAPPDRTDCNLTVLRNGSGEKERVREEKEREEGRRRKGRGKGRRESDEMSVGGRGMERKGDGWVDKRRSNQ